MSAHYFHIIHANRENFEFRFQPYLLSAGTLLGVLRTEDDAVAEKLTALAEKDKTITKLTKGEFWAIANGERNVESSRQYFKDLLAIETLTPETPQTAAFTSEPPTVEVPPPPQGLAVEEKAGVVVDGASLPTPVEVTSAPVETEAALEVGEVTPTAAKAKRASRRGQLPEQQ